MDRKNYIEFACGMKGSGKSTLLARHAARFPRRVIIDPTAEFFDLYPQARECMTLSEVLNAFEDVAALPQWVVVACISARDAAKVIHVLAPEDNPRGGYSVAVGGVLVECGEVEMIAPNDGRMSADIGHAFHRGRHQRISFCVGTRRPRDVHRLVTSQCDVISAFKQHEPRDVEYLTKLVTPTVAQCIDTLPDYHHVRYLPNYRRASIVDARGNEIEVIHL